MASVALLSSPGARSVDARVRAAIDAHYTRIWRFLRRLGVAESFVEDAAQQVFWVLSTRADVVSRAAERSFLFGTALRVASDFRNKRERSREVPGNELFGNLADPRPDAETQLVLLQRRRRLDEVLDHLPENLRATFVLAELEEMTMAEVGEVLSIPPGTVASRLRKARSVVEEKAAELRARIEEENAR